MKTKCFKKPEVEEKYSDNLKSIKESSSRKRADLNSNHLGEYSIYIV